MKPSLISGLCAIRVVAIVTRVVAIVTRVVAIVTRVVINCRQKKIGTIVKITRIALTGRAFDEITSNLFHGLPCNETSVSSALYITHVIYDNQYHV